MKQVKIDSSVLESVLSYQRELYPREGILLLRGRTKKDEILVYDVVIPPLAVHGDHFSSFPSYMLPMDFSIIGTAHSHPSGVLQPSPTDLNKFYGKIMIIAKYPFNSKEDVAVFDRTGEPIPYVIIDGETVRR